MIFTAAQQAYAQPANYAWIAEFDESFSNTRTFTDAATGAAVRRLTVQATQASRGYVIEWDGFNNKWQNTSTPLNQEFTLFHGGNASPNGQLTADAVIDDYYTFQIDGLAYSNRAAVVMQTSAMPVNFANTEPVSFNTPVRPGEGLEINVTLAGNKSPEERAFVRYSTDNFASSEVAEVTFASATASSGTATIPAVVNQDNQAVTFYVYTTTIAATSSSNHDLISLALANNGGPNYSYTPVFPTPDVIILSSPANAATSLSPETTLRWEAGENTAEYLLQLSATNSFAESDLISEVVTADTSTAVSFKMDETYYWRVRGRNSGGHGAFSSAFSFTTLAPQVSLSGNGNTGFGGVIGNSRLDIGDDGSRLYFNFVRAGGNTSTFDDELLLYFSTGAAGRAAIDADINDQSSIQRRAVSSAGENASVLRFLEGFEATHAAVLSPDGSALFEIPASGAVGNDALIELAGLTGAPNAGNFEFSLSYADLGLNSGDPFDITGVYLNGANGFTSNEGYGAGFPDANIGGDDFDFGSFISYPTGVERSAFISVADGNWSEATTWREGVIPPSGEDITISHAVAVDVPTAVARNLSIAETGALSFSANGQGVLTLTGGSRFTNSGSFDGANGKVIFQGGGSITESSAQVNAVAFNEVEISDGSMIFRDDTIINTRLSLLSGGSISGGNAPVYAAGSELRFAQGEAITLNTGTAWLPGDSGDVNTAQQGIPYDVLIDGTTDISFDGATTRVAKGRLNIAASARLQLSEQVGGDLRLFGDWENQGTFEARNRAVFFSGGVQQKVMAGQPTDFGFMIVDNDSDVLIQSETAASGQIELNSGSLRLGGNGLISGAPRLVLKGGVLQSDGFSATFGPLRLEQAAQITLGSGVHQLKFASSRDESWTGDSSQRMLITGWQGTPGASGTGGQITFERPAGFSSGLLSTTQGLTPEQRGQIRFENTAGDDFKTAFLDAETASLELIPIGTDEENPPVAHAEGLGLNPDVSDNVGTFYADLKWKNGGGTGRIIVARADAAVSALPADGKLYGRAENDARTFGFDVPESEIGSSGNFVVFDSAFSDFDDSVADSSNARIKRIAGDSNVHFAIFEYVGSGSERNYLTTADFATFNQQTGGSYATTGGGNWNDAGVWPGDIAPVSPVEITISHNVVVNVATATFSDIIIEENNTLSFTEGGALVISAGSIQAAGNIDACSGSAPAGCTGKITFNNGVEITGSGSINLYDVDVLGEQDGSGNALGSIGPARLGGRLYSGL